MTLGVDTVPLHLMGYLVQKKKSEHKTVQPRCYVARIHVSPQLTPFGYLFLNMRAGPDNNRGQYSQGQGQQHLTIF